MSLAITMLANFLKRPGLSSTSILLSVLLVFMWLNSGTLNPYAFTHSHSIVSPHCNYLLNPDHPHHLGPYLMLRGDSPDKWQGSVVLRRVLFHFLAFPFYRAWGFIVGGFVLSCLLHICAFIVLSNYLKQRFRPGTCLAGLAIFVTYPGIFYWSGLPYCYALIVPGSIFGLALLSKIELLSAQNRPWLSFWPGLGLGVLCTGYDFFAFFAGALLLLGFWQRKILATLVSLVGVLAPQILVFLLLAYYYETPLNNSNTKIYSDILGAFVDSAVLAKWLNFLAAFPGIFFESLLYSVHIGLFWAGLISVCLIFKILGKYQSRTWICLSLSVIGILCVLNLAPPYSGTWQMRGAWIARLYQPIFLPLLLFCCVAYEHYSGSTRQLLKRTVQLGLGLLLIYQTSVTLAPIAGWYGLLKPHSLFYLHDGLDVPAQMLEKYGRRPLGVCRPGNIS